MTHKLIRFLAIFILVSFISCKKDSTLTSSGVEIIIPSGNENYLNMSSDYIFDQEQLHTFELNLPEGALAFIDSDPSAKEYVEGSLTFDGEVISPIGIRYKGSVGDFWDGLSGENGSLSGHKIVTKLSMKIKIDWKGYNSTFYQLKKLQFDAMNGDNSQMHHRLGHWLFREMGVPASRAAHARVIINGTYYGIYSLVEEVDEQFTKYNFNDGSGNLYKSVWPLKSDGSIQSDKELYQNLRTNRVAGVSANRIKEFAKEVIESSEIELQNVIEDNMIIDEIISHIVVDRTIRHDDGPFHWYCGENDCSPHNFFWYENPTLNKVHLIPWDLDAAFDNITPPFNNSIFIVDDWGVISENCEPYYFGGSSSQRSATCDKLTRGWAEFTTKYNQLKTNFLQGPLSESTVKIDQWINQIRDATIEANKLHSDAISLEQWESAIWLLKEQLEYAKTH
ncbi:MAG: CotH kinase family protein [Bacteroidota bacterium]|nr:CotH kinase family protein [Bacteroidota bacterium]